MVYTKIFNNLAHAFCGFSKFTDLVDGANRPSLTSTYTATSSALTVTQTNTVSVGIYHTCALFGAKTVCDSDPEAAVLATGTDRITIEENMGTNGSGDQRV